MALILEVNDEKDGIVLSWGGAKKAVVRVVSRKGNKTKLAIQAPHSVSIGRTNPNEKTPPHPWESRKRGKSCSRN